MNGCSMLIGTSEYTLSISVPKCSRLALSSLLVSLPLSPSPPFRLISLYHILVL